MVAKGLGGAGGGGGVSALMVLCKGLSQTGSCLRAGHSISRHKEGTGHSLLDEGGQREADLMRTQKQGGDVSGTGWARIRRAQGGRHQTLVELEEQVAWMPSAPARLFFSSLALTTVFQVTHFTSHFTNLYSLLIILCLLSRLPLKTRIWVE